jgi:DNA-binding Xre family transcriptional regulator
LTLQIDNPISNSYNPICETFSGGDYMGWSYVRLWHLLLDKGMTKRQLRLAIGASSSTFAKMGKGEPVSMDVLDKICNHLQCSIDEIVEHVPDQGE